MDLMLASAQEILWGAHSSVPLAVGVVAMVVTLSRRRYGARGFVVVATLGLLWWAVLVVRNPPAGSNYSIYRYNAELTLRGEPSFGRTPSPSDSASPPSFEEPRYLDYSGSQHGIYVLLTNLDFSALHRKLGGFGFQLWSLLSLLAAVTAIRVARFLESDPESFSQRTYAVALLAFHPVFTLHWLVIAWEDKLVHFILPFLTLVLVARRHFGLAALLAGWATALNGTLLFFLPALLLHVARVDRARAGRAAVLLVVGMALGMAPFSPVSLAGWQSRMERLAAPHPFWFSIWNLLPEGAYSPVLGRALVLSLAVLVNAAFASRWVRLEDVALTSVGVSLTLGPDNVVERVAPLILLLAALTPRTTRRDWVVLACVLMLYLGLSPGFSPGRINRLHTIAFHIPLGWALYRYVQGRLAPGGPAAAPLAGGKVGVGGQLAFPHFRSPTTPGSSPLR